MSEKNTNETNEVSTKEFDVTSHKVLDGALTKVIKSIPEVEGEKPAKQICEVTGAKVTYLYQLENSAGEQKNVSQGVIKAQLIANGKTAEEALKICDKVYNVAYNATNASAKPRMTDEQKAKEINSFLS